MRVAARWSPPAADGRWFWDGGLFHLRRSLRRDMWVLLGKDGHLARMAVCC